MLRGKAKVSHTCNEKLIFCLKLLFTQAYVKIIQSICTHSWVVGGFFCCKSGCRHSNCKRHVEIHAGIFGGFICVPRCSCCFSCNGRSYKESVVFCCLLHTKKLWSNRCRSASVRTWCAGSLVAGDLCCSDLPLRVCEMKPMWCVQLLLSEQVITALCWKVVFFVVVPPPPREQTCMSLCWHRGYCLVLPWQLDRLSFQKCPSWLILTVIGSYEEANALFLFVLLKWWLWRKIKLELKFLILTKELKICSVLDNLLPGVNYGT